MAKVTSLIEIGQMKKGNEYSVYSRQNDGSILVIVTGNLVLLKKDQYKSI